MSSFSFPDFPPEPLDSTDDNYQQSPTSLGGDLSLPTVSSSSMLKPIDATSPFLHDINTPAESELSNYQSSSYSEAENGDDSWFNTVDFNALGGNTLSLPDFHLFDTPVTASVSTPEPFFQDSKTYLISPDQTPSLNTFSPHHSATPAQRGLQENVALTKTFLGVGLISPHQLVKQEPATKLAQFNGFEVDIATQLTPDSASSGDSLGNTSHGGFSREEGNTYTAVSMAGQNPYVTVSQWDKDDGAGGDNPSLAVEASFGPKPNQNSALGTSADDSTLQWQSPAKPAVPQSVMRNQHGAWEVDSVTGLGGIDPSSRLTTETATSLNEDADARKVAAQNTVVSQWLDATKYEVPIAITPSSRRQEPGFEGVSDRDISLGHETQNIEQFDRIYYKKGNGPLNATDYDIMLSNHVWENAPTSLPITQIAEESDRRQPESSQAAIEKFEKMYRDNASYISRSATWGTRRRSLPSVTDMEGITSGNFFKKLSLSRGDTRRPSIFEGLRTLVRMPSTSQQPKRVRTSQEIEKKPTLDTNWGDFSFGESRRDSNSLVPPSRTLSTGKNKQHMPSINTALVNMGSSVASIGTTHARNGSVSRQHTGSVSLSPPLTSPKSPLLKVSNSLRRQRSKSLSKATPENPHPNLVRMLKTAGGPPVANLATGNSAYGPQTPTLFSMNSLPLYTSTNAPVPAPVIADPDDDDDDEDEAFDEGDVKPESDGLINTISPDLKGFRELVFTLNPTLSSTNTYLVDRIAYQQIQRYKSLLNNKVRHLSYVKGNNCPSGDLCIEQGGASVLLDGKMDVVPLDPLSTGYGSADIGDLASPLDGAVSPENWTKHVHEDVQPFTCTWDRCREPKIFKRKADWVRHENEGHRHLEWWTCDVDECRHTCYRRDNFLQHLVREHKFPEPKHKTKAAIKKAGATDETWQRVEQCHAETTDRPQNEPCKFCGKTFPTWKKLTVHLAKHMEHISLPILKLVERKELDADTLISPVQEPPQRNFAPTPTFPSVDETQHNMMPNPSNLVSMTRVPPGPFHQTPLGHTMAYVPTGAPESNDYVYPTTTQTPYQRSYYGQQSFAPPMGMASQMQSLNGAAINVIPVSAPYTGAAYGPGHLPLTTTGYQDPTSNRVFSNSSIDAVSYPGFSTAIANPLGLQTSLSSGQMDYELVTNPSIGSIPPYKRAPLKGQGQFYG
ncbi:c2h2 finger domain containing protein [Grosmannia clavigera kw1407]|uniref:C2h2 finger domain containing protein n=1 Tax=Grosmannia clavigera (strain kw1407 / UAMH 11150) TaxID=655863 RepID=F0X9D7_GROCL|nr:c2h2 finger domain containing protein [Grosmannia clavigera kw1407]EFX05438.1 c2h2 finger domain containing protein [Grosmannia clavigera kw1407]